MSTDSRAVYKTVCQRVVHDLFNGRNYDVIPELYHPECFSDDVGHADYNIGREQLKTLLDQYEAAFPGHEYRIVDLVADEESAAIHMEVTGVHKGVFMGFQPTEKPFSVRGMAVCKFRDDKICEVKQMFDLFSLFMQLGLMEVGPRPMEVAEAKLSDRN